MLLLAIALPVELKPDTVKTFEPDRFVYKCGDAGSTK